MKKLLLLTAVLAGMAMTSHAQQLSSPSLVGGNMVLSLNDLTITWNLQEIEFTNPTTFPTAPHLTFSATPVTIKSEDGSFTSKGTVALTTIGSQLLGSEGEDKMAINGIQVYMWDPEPIDANYNPLTGNFSISIPKGLVKAVDGGETNEAASIDVKVMQENYSGASITPAPGQSYLPAELMEVVLTWKNNGAELCTLTQGEGNISYRNAKEGATGVDGGSDAPVHILPVDNYQFDGNRLLLDLSIITTPGQYDFFIPSTFVIMNGSMLSAETTFNYTIAELPTMADATQITPSPSKDTNLVFLFDTPVSLSEDGLAPSFAVNDFFMKEAAQIPLDAISIYDNKELEIASLKGEYVSISLSDLLTAEDNEKVVYVKIPEGLFVNEEGAVNVEQTFRFLYEDETLSISKVGSNDVQAPVYNLQGVKTDDKLKNLPKGIYIIGGKKVAVK